MKKNYFLFLFLFSVLTIYPQINVEWMNKYSNDPTDTISPTNLVLDSQKNSYISGKDINNNTFFMLKYDEDGAELWRKTYANSVGNNQKIINNILYSTKIVDDTVYLKKYSLDGTFLTTKQIVGFLDPQDPEDFFSVSGRMYSHDSNFYFLIHTSSYLEINKTHLYKTDLDGNYIWHKTYSLTHTLGLRFDADDNMILYGRKNLGYYTNPNGVEGDTKSDAYLRKIDLNGDVIWIKIIAAPEDSFESLYSLSIDENNNYYAIYKDDSVATDFSYILKKFNSDAEEMWDVIYTHPISGTQNWIRGVICNNSKIYVKGYSYQPGVSNMLTICYDTDGNEVWNDTYYTNADYVYSYFNSVFDNRNNIYVFGFGNSINDRTDILTRVYNEEGTVLSDFDYNSTGVANEHPLRVQIDLNKIYLLAGSDTNTMLLKLSTDYASHINENKFDSFLIFPNPADDKLNIHFSNYSNAQLDLVVFKDLLGKTVLSREIDATTQEFSLNLKSGVYFVSFLSKNQVLFVKKLIIK